MKRKLRVSDEASVSEFCNVGGWDSFYHYFPLMYAISESTQPLLIDEHLNIFAGAGELYIEGEALLDDDELQKVWVSLGKAPRGWSTEMYDVNFIYDLETTLAIKNLRMNVKKFIRDNPNIEYSKAKSNSDEGLYPVILWYEKTDRRTLTDFGYTMWLTKNYNKFQDLQPRVVKINGRIVSFSLWGRLSEKLGIHLICKCDPVTYLNDYTRYMTYEEMKSLVGAIEREMRRMQKEYKLAA